ncbi:hypothetical protein F5879DRAFT_988040 [Lentinula edodes]|nr:hypothetical protein F5879DRAFT_988040 [Lentinula edodes]
MAPERSSSNLPISSRRRMRRTTGPSLRRHPMITRGMAAAWSDAAEEENEHNVQPLSTSAVQHEYKEEIFAYMKESDAILHTQKDVVNLLQERAVTLKDEKAVLQRTLAAETAARKEIFQCPICLELAWNPHILHSLVSNADILFAPNALANIKPIMLYDVKKK